MFLKSLWSVPVAIALILGNAPAALAAGGSAQPAPVKKTAPSKKSVMTPVPMPQMNDGGDDDGDRPVAKKAPAHPPVKIVKAKTKKATKSAKTSKGTKKTAKASKTSKTAKTGKASKKPALKTAPKAKKPKGKGTKKTKTSRSTKHVNR